MKNWKIKTQHNHMFHQLIGSLQRYNYRPLEPLKPVLFSFINNPCQVASLVIMLTKTCLAVNVSHYFDPLSSFLIFKSPESAEFDSDVMNGM